MTETNDTLRQALREIEIRAAAALANQPNDADECGRRLNKALAVIELAAHVARSGGWRATRRASSRRSDCTRRPPGAARRKPGKS